jgi:hypothetical protein
MKCAFNRLFCHFILIIVLNGLYTGKFIAGISAKLQFFIAQKNDLIFKISG